ncbi:uncharacterized protein LOC122034948 [Zingiber officinale]|uniref:uncharacterized protein LOC122034948 n=1 Tax=Zingiber officinale TaxID=94328 RepID=UPI001C4D4FBB|nr:uncharacterized protein LOC122034948 [Zingiber officinale]XP_042450241.1 uncharacterized protein LOC122034948 [Zingiber officinale]
MNSKARVPSQAVKASPRPRPRPRRDKGFSMEKTIMQANGSNVVENGHGKFQSRRQRKIALEQDVDKLKKKLRNEENIHRALERAFTRTLGALPRLPPYLPSHTLELLAEVAVLEEEVVRLEEQVINFRQGLYQEAIYISSCKKSKELRSDICSLSQNSKTSGQPTSYSDSTCSEDLIFTKQTDASNIDQDVSVPSSGNPLINTEIPPKKLNSSLAIAENKNGKENQMSTNFSRNCKKSPVKRVSRGRMGMNGNKQGDAKPRFNSVDSERIEKDSLNSSNEAKRNEYRDPNEVKFPVASDPNKLSEDILKCLTNILSRGSSPGNKKELLETITVSGSWSNLEETDRLDPYGICEEFGKRDIGPYKYFRSVEASSNFSNLLTGCSFLSWRLKRLLRELASVDLSGLTHHQKIAFWINIYNACMMNAFLEQGIPISSEMIVALMLKAMINVGGHLVSAMTIEHFILRLPYQSKHISFKGSKSDGMAMRGIFGLEWPEPLVTFALSCGSWSSPAVRVYTGAQIEKELEKAKRDYLQAAIGISTPNKLAIPKLLDWYLRDFAKDVESLMDWICLQLPNELRTEAVRCLEVARRSTFPQPIQVLPYEFRFRYIFAP